MEFEFDKEIDVLLRRARDSEKTLTTGVLPSAHLDADEISAFAENALPEKTKQFYTAHLAECARCRTILSNLIAFNAEAEIETASAAVSVPAAETSAPWYRKLFLFPQLTLTMGALVVLFGGFFALIVLQNLFSGKNSAVSYQSEKSAPSADRPAFSTTNSSNANTASTANTAVNTTNTTAPSNTTATNSSSALSNSTTSVPRIEEPELRDDAATMPPVPASTPAVLATPADAQLSEAEKIAPQIQPAPKISQPTAGNSVAKEENKNDVADTAITQEDKSLRRQQAPKPDSARSGQLSKAPEKKKSESGEQRFVGGKTFNNVGGIWFDSAYGKQTPKTVARGSGEYQKLDGGLRSIAEALGGTVVVLWKGKAYRIQ